MKTFTTENAEPAEKRSEETNELKSQSWIKITSL